MLKQEQILKLLLWKRTIQLKFSLRTRITTQDVVGYISKQFEKD